MDDAAYFDNGITVAGSIDLADLINFDDIVDSATLDANFTVASAGYTFTITDATTTIGSTVFNTFGNVGINAGNNIDTRFEVGGAASISGNITTLGTFTSTNTGSSSFTGSLNVSKGIHGLADITATGQILSYGAASNSFSGGLSVTKGLRVTGNVTNDALTASRLVSANGNKVLASTDIVNWIAGTTNQITVTDDTDGSATLSLPQDIHTSATPQFAKLGLGTVPVTVLEVQGTASASYGLFGALQVAGFSSQSYSRFGTTATTHGNYISQADDVLVSGDLQVEATLSLGGTASISGNLFALGNVGIGMTSPQSWLHIGIDPNYLSNYVRFEGGSSGDSSIQQFYTAAAWNQNTYARNVGGSGYVYDTANPASQIVQDSGDITFNAVVSGTAGSLITWTPTMIIKNSGKVGINTTTPSTVFEIQGTASASYILTGNTLQVGGFSSAAYSRFGTGTATYTNFITTTNDLLISGDLEVDATAQFDSFTRVSANSARAFVITDMGGFREDIFVVDTTASKSNSGLEITGGAGQTNPLLLINNTSTTIVTVASIQATSLTRGNILTIEVPASTSHKGSYLLIEDTNNVVYASMGYGGRFAVRRQIFSHGATTTCTGAGSGCIDYAESFPTKDKTLEAGDLVAADSTNLAHVVKASTNNSSVLGIISTNPAALIDGNAFKTGAETGNISSGSVPVALAGRVPVKVSLENGPIIVGDRLTISSTPGVAMKAVKAGQVVAMALESQDNIASGSYGQILAFVNVSYWAPSESAVMASVSSSSEDIWGTLNPNTLMAFIADQFQKMFDIVFERGLLRVAKIVTDRIVTNELCIDDICITKNEFKSLLEKNGIPTTPQPEPILTPSPTPEPTPTLTSTPEPTPETEPTPTLISTPSPTPTVIEPTPEVTLEPTPTPSPTPEPTPEITPEPTPEPTPIPETTPEIIAVPPEPVVE